MVYKYEAPYEFSLNKIDIVMVFNLNEWYYEEAIEETVDQSTVVYDLDYGEHLMLHLKCNDVQCNLNVTSVGVYDNEKGQPHLVTTEEYHVNFSRSLVADIAETRYAPAILKNFMKYLRPFNIPDYWYTPQDICSIIEKIKKFFSEYLNECD